MPAATQGIPETARVVQMPVCMVCGRVGKQPQGGDRRNIGFKCVGPEGNRHKQRAMVLVIYEAKGVA